MKNFKWKYQLTEGLLIVFSVLFALFINKLYDDYKLSQEKEIALESIRTELMVNDSIVQRWSERHQAIRARIQALIRGELDSLKKEIQNATFLKFGLLTDNENLVDNFPTNTGWEAAKSTGILSEFDFEDIQKFTQAYNLQEFILDRTFRNITDVYFSAEAHNMENLDATLIQFYLLLTELVGQEEILLELYANALED